jgi:chemotaxis protein MotB
MARLSLSARRSAAKAKRPIVVKRIVKHPKSLRSGGTWKIAYADFVTAVMAFFLLLWLVNSSSANSLRGISEYFKAPLMITLAGGKTVSSANQVIGDGNNVPSEGAAQVKMSEPETETVTKSSMEQARVNLRLQEIDRLRQLKSHLENVIDSHPDLQKFKDQLLLDITTDGLRIQIIDKQNRPMFSLGSTAPQPYAEEILREIGKALNEVPNRISISGHTDAAPYQGAELNYTNWELSIDRANASRRELISGGMASSKIIRVVGLSSSALMDAGNPLNPNNRRISIIVMNSLAEKSALMTQ